MSADEFVSYKDFFIDIKRTEHNWSMGNSHYHNAYEIYYLTEGSRLMLVQNKVYELYPGDVILLRPNIFHRTMHNGAHKRVNIVFTDKTLGDYFTKVSAEYLSSCFKSEYIHLSLDENKVFSQLYSQLKTEYESNVPFFVTLADLLRLLCDALERQKMELKTSKKILSKSSRKIDAIISYIVANYSRINSIDDIANSCYLNKSYMCRLFKNETGMTVFEYLNSIKLQKACEMMRKTNDSITDIAMKCGFSSTSYFSYAFKDAMSCTPSQFRKRLFTN